MAETDVPRVRKTIEVLVELLVCELDSHAPIAFRGVKDEKDEFVRMLETIPRRFGSWWRRSPRT